jgi:hypothetical protein
MVFTTANDVLTTTDSNPPPISHPEHFNHWPLDNLFDYPPYCTPCGVKVDGIEVFFTRQPKRVTCPQCLFWLTMHGI